MTAPYTPVWMAPGQAGALSNGHGSNATTDSIPFQAKHRTPQGGANPLSLVRMQAFRTGVGGNPSTSQPAWDSGWLGGSPAVRQLPVGKQACGGNSTVSYNGRLYFMPNDGTIMSCPVASAAVGSWRYENPLPAGTSGTLPAVYSMTRVAYRLYCTASITSFGATAAYIYMAQINSDGTLGSWTSPVFTPAGFAPNDGIWKQTGLVGSWDGTSATGNITAWNTTLNSGQLEQYYITIADGNVASLFATGSVPTVLRDNLTAGFIAPVAGAFKLFLVGGTATAASSVVDVSPMASIAGNLTGVFAAKQALPATRTGGTLVTLQDGTVYYMGGSSGIVASSATTTVYYNTATAIFNISAAWTASAQVLPSPTWLSGGGLYMTDYDLLALAKSVNPDSITEIFTGNGLVANTDAMAIVSFKSTGVVALVGALGAFTTGTNTTVSPPFGQATVATHLLTAWVSGSDETVGGATNLGSTGSATFSYDFAQAPNEIMGPTFTVPAGGIYVNSLSMYWGGYGGTVYGAMCLWDGNGYLLVNGAGFYASSGKSLYTSTVNTTFVSAGTTLSVGIWWDHLSGTSGGWAQWGVASSGNFFYYPASGTVGSPGGVAYNTCAGSGFVCGNTQSYLTYSTLIQADITTAAAGWVRAVSRQNTTEQVQIWYKPNCGAAEAAPTFTSANGTSPLYAQLAEFSNVATVTPVDQAAGFAQGSASTTMTTTNPAPDAAAGNLVLSATRWVTSVAGTATFADSTNVGAATVRAGSSGASSTTRHACFNYVVVPSGGTLPTRAPGVVVVGGQNTAAAPRTDVWSAQVNPTITNPQDIYAWSLIAGVGTAATVGNLGTGAVLAGNPDGSQDITMMYGIAGTYAPSRAQGTLFIPTFVDGDQVTVTVQTVGTDGDPSPLASTQFVIGQPPVATGLTPATSGVGGQPAIGFSFNPGLGGGPQATWRAKIVGNTSGIVYADSGVRSDQSNAWNPLLAPMLTASEAYTLTATVTSTDTPFSSTSNNSGTATQSFDQSGASTPTMPTNVSVTTSAVFCGAVLTWTSSPPTGGYNRVYYKRSQAATWYLLKDLVTGSPVSLADQLAIGVAYDFAVSMVDSNGNESALSGQITATYEVAGTTQRVYDDPLNNLNALTLVNGVAGTLTSNVLTLAIGTDYVFGHPELTDGTVQGRFIFATGTVPIMFWHRTYDAPNNLTSAVVAEVNGTSFNLDKYVSGNYTAQVAKATISALTNATAYWLEAGSVGTTYTVSLYNDSAGARGTLIATVSATIIDPIVQMGRALIGEFGGGAGLKWGGTGSTVLNISAPMPYNWTVNVRGVGNTDFGCACWSPLNPHTGARSLSWFSPTANAYGFFVYTPNIATVVGVPVYFGAWVRGPAGLVTNNSFYLLHDNVASGLTYQAAWAYQSNTVVPTFTGGQQIALIPAASGTLVAGGLYYFDDFTFSVPAASAVTIPGPTGAYTATLHVPGSTALVAPVYLKGGPTTKETIESVQAAGFGQAAPLVRLGVGDYRDLDLVIQQHISADFGPLEAVLAQMRAGVAVYLRTAAGHLLQVALKPNQEISFLPANYLGVRTIKLGLLQVPNSYTPALPFGAAQGMLTQVAGATPPLDPSELAL